MRISDSDLRTARPVRRYVPPKYPTRTEARLGGRMHFSLPARALLKLGRIALASSMLIPAVGAEPSWDGSMTEHPGDGSGCGGRYDGYISAPIARRYLEEDEARLLIISKFSAEGVTFDEDVQYSSTGVAFNADGFDGATGVGFEYESKEDNELSRDLYPTDRAGWDAIFLTRAEEEILETDMKSGGDCVRPFESGLGATDDEERELLGKQVDSFIEWLKANGII